MMMRIAMSTWMMEVADSFLSSRILGLVVNSYGISHCGGDGLDWMCKM
jgi:hypothetical protein